MATITISVRCATRERIEKRHLYEYQCPELAVYESVVADLGGYIDGCIEEVTASVAAARKAEAQAQAKLQKAV